MNPADLREKLESSGVSLPWAYRPYDHDDWGFIRGPEKVSDLIGPYRPIVANSRQSDVNEEQMAAHREAKTDPYEPVGQLIVAAVNALPELLDALAAKDTRIAELEGALRPFAKDAEDWDAVSGVSYDDSLELWQSRRTSVNVGHLRAARLALTAEEG